MDIELRLPNNNPKIRIKINFIRENPLTASIDNNKTPNCDTPISIPKNITVLSPMREIIHTYNIKEGIIKCLFMRLPFLVMDSRVLREKQLFNIITN
jgi:hypothetical protein